MFINLIFEALEQIIYISSIFHSLMSKTIDRVVTALTGAAIAIGVLKGPQVISQTYAKLTEPEPAPRGIVANIEYKIVKDNGEEVLAYSRGLPLAQQGEHIEFRLGWKGGFPHESLEAQKDGTKVAVRTYPKQLKDVKPVVK